MDPLYGIETYVYDIETYDFLNRPCICSDCQNPSNMQADITDRWSFSRKKRPGFKTRCPYALLKLIGVMTVELSLPLPGPIVEILVEDLKSVLRAKQRGNLERPWLPDHGFGDNCDTFYWFRIRDVYYPNYRDYDNTHFAAVEIEVGYQNIEKDSGEVIYECILSIPRQGLYHSCEYEIPVNERYPLPTLQQACESRHYNVTNTALRLTQGN